MTLVFDTSILVDIENKNLSTIKLIRELTKKYPARPSITVINHYEFLWGLRNKSQTYRSTQELNLNKFFILQTSRLTPVILCSLRVKYESRGISIALPDLVISALTIENNMTLLTKDKDFEKIKELKKIIL